MAAPPIARAAAGGAPAGAARANSNDYSWEKEHAPRISRAYMAGVAALFAAWTLFLAGMAVYRWYLTLL